MPQILVTKPGVLSKNDKAKLRRAEIVAIEADRPEDVKLMAVSGAELGANDMLFAAMKALSGGGNCWDIREAFTKALLAQMGEDRATKSDAPTLSSSSPASRED